MPFDGIVIRSLVNELNDLLINERIEKIYQPEEDEIVVKVRNYKLLLCVNSSFPHLSLTDIQKTNPLQAPMFCMLLRKHLQGGRFTEIKQIGLERIIEFSIESYDELGNLTLKKLYCEIMGKHSNIILVDGKTNTIIDSIKRIPVSISRVRQVLPGLKYDLPPSKGKINLLEICYEDFVKIIKSKDDILLHKVIYQSFQGISPLVAQELCKRSSLNGDIMPTMLNEEEIKSLWNNILILKNIILKNEFSPNVIFDNGKAIDLSVIELSIYNNDKYQIIRMESASSAVNRFYYDKDRYERLKQKSNSIIKLIDTRLERLYNKLQKLKEELAISLDADKYRIYGELILSYINTIKKGMEKVRVYDYYSDEEIEIPLDKRLTPSENSQAYFSKYNKYKTAYQKVNEQIQEAEKEISYLEDVLNSIEKVEDVSDIEEIIEELAEQGYLRRRVDNKKTKPSTLPLKYISSDGFTIEAGKNNYQNDRLTHNSSKLDIWLHTKNIPGSHVIIRTDGKEVPESTLLEAAKIAAYNSKGRYSSKVPVDYTFIKYVKKPSGAKPGKVIYTNYKTVYVTPIEEEIKKLRLKDN